MGDRDLIISQIRQRLEILYQMVEELENQPSPGPGPGTSDYDDLSNKPSINNVELKGNKTAAQLGLATSSSVSSITSRFEDLITPDNISIEDNGQLPSSIDSRLALHQPIMLNHVIYYCEDESGVGYTYVALDTSGAYPKFSYAQIFKDNKRVHFYDFATDTVPASDSDNFITSGGVYSAIQDLATVARTGSYTDLSNKPTLGAAAAKGVDSSPTPSSTNLVESGGVSAALNGKQNSLTTAQLNAVSSGITSAKVSQYDTDSAATAELVDNGAKNLLDPLDACGYNGQSASFPITISGITFTLNANGTITTSGSSTSTRNLRIPITLPAGTYHFGGSPSGGGSSSYRIDLREPGSDTFITTTVDTGQGITYTFETTTSLDVCLRIGANYSTPATFSPIVCTKVQWDVSQKFVPYCPSMAELYAMIRALQT